MIISDLNYLEITSEEVLGGYTFVANKQVAIVSNINDTHTVNKNVYQNVHLVGNFANGEGQATAFGNNTLAQVFSFTHTTPNTSAANSLSTSATKS